MIEHCPFLNIPSILDQEILLFWKDTFEKKGKTCLVKYDTASYRSYSENKVNLKKQAKQDSKNCFLLFRFKNMAYYTLQVYHLELRQKVAGTEFYKR